MKRANRFSQKESYDPRVIQERIKEIKKQVKERKREKRNRK